MSAKQTLIDTVKLHIGEPPSGFKLLTEKTERTQEDRNNDDTGYSSDDVITFEFGH